MDVINWLGDIFTKCWEFWNYEITFSGITFTLANVAEVSVFVWVFSLLIGNLLEDQWGAD